MTRGGRSKQALGGDHILGRPGTPAGIAEVAVILLSPDSNWITGIDIPVDGGHAVTPEEKLRAPSDEFEKTAEGNKPRPENG